MCSGVGIAVGEGAEGATFTGRAGVGEEEGERRDLLKIYVYFCYDKAAGTEAGTVLSIVVTIMINIGTW